MVEKHVCQESRQQGYCEPEAPVQGPATLMHSLLFTLYMPQYHSVILYSYAYSLYFVYSIALVKVGG